PALLPELDVLRVVAGMAHAAGREPRPGQPALPYRDPDQERQAGHDRPDHRDGPLRAGRVLEADEAVELTAGGVGDRRGQGEYPRRALDLVTGVTTGAARYGHGRLLPGVAQDDDQGG